MKTRKILLSAYACEPNKGSEPGVGWHWALELARLGHDVWVLTRANNRPPIEAALAGRPSGSTPRFLYYDLPAWARWWKKGPRGVVLYYVLWQCGAYRIARKFHRQERFDLVHHITFGTVRHPSFMGNLRIPFVFGPVGGGEKAPWRLRFGCGARGCVLEALRDVLNFLVRFDPLMRRTFRQAERIYGASEKTLALLPRRYQAKATVQIAIGYEGGDVSPRTPADTSRAQVPEPGLKLLYVGKFLYWKGMHLGLPAFAGLLKNHSDARLTMVGNGPEERRWRKLAKHLGISEQTNWISWVTLDELFKLYRQYDVLLYPSLHDSPGLQIVEAMAHGLPVVCLDLGGTAIVDDTCGRAIKAAGMSRDAVVNGLAHALTELAAADISARTRLARGALLRARHFDWRTVVRRAYSEIPAYRP